MFLRGLPLKEDQEESMAVYTCIYSLVLASNPEVFILHFFSEFCCQTFISCAFGKFFFLGCKNQILSHVPDLVKIFGQVLESPVEKVEVKAIVGRTFSHLISVYGNQLEPFISVLPPSQANLLAAYASAN